MNKLIAILFVIICIPANAGTFSSEGHPKSNKLNISVSYPETWIAKEAIRPHVVQSFKDKSDNLSQCLLTIMPIGQTLSKSEWQHEFAGMVKSDYEDVASELGNLISYKNTAYESYNGVLIESSG